MGISNIEKRIDDFIDDIRWLQKDYLEELSACENISWKASKRVRKVIKDIIAFIEEEKKKSYEKGQEDLKEAVRERAKAFMMNGHGDFWEMLLRLIGDINTEEDCDKAIEDAVK